MSLAIFYIVVVCKRSYRPGKIIAAIVIDVTIQVYGDVIVARVIIFTILPGIDYNAHTWRNALETDTTTGAADISTDRLKNEDHSIGAICINATQVNIKFEIKGLAKVDLIDIPY